ncbi:uncharacterized protein LOC144477538 [Augochlora pura]
MPRIPNEMTILQINLHRCKMAQDLMTQYATEKDYNIVVISELYCIHSTWYGDLNQDAAIWITPATTKKVKNVQIVFRGKGVVAIAIDDLKIFSCYISPNIPLEEFQDIVDAVDKEVNRVGSSLAIIAGDLNAKSVIWSSKITDNRGLEILEMAARNDLTPIRSQGDYTFERDGHKSLIDIVLCGKDCASALLKSVILDDFTASDHRYLRHIFKWEHKDKHLSQETIQHKKTKVDLDVFVEKIQELT